jgi:transmembrane sensor
VSPELTIEIMTTPPSDPQTPAELETDGLARLVRLAATVSELDAATRARLAHNSRPYWQAAVQKRRRRRGMTLGLLAAAASLLVALGLSRLELGHGPAAILTSRTGELLVDGDPPSAQDPVVLRGQTVKTTGARAGLRLGDGTTLRMDRETELRLDDAGLELTHGAVYVDTAEQRRDPVRVVTAHGVVRDIGTRFEVRIDEGDLVVSVRDGLVELRREGSRWLVHPGERARLAPGAPPVRETLAGDSPWLWTLEVATARDFDGKELGDFLAWVEHETGDEVRFAEPSLEAAALGSVVHGEVEGLVLFDALDVVLRVSGLEARREDGTLLLSRSADSPRETP